MYNTEKNLENLSNISNQKIPIWEKLNLTIDEAAAYSNIGINKLQDLARQPDCNFVLRVGKRKLIKRKEFEKFLTLRCAI